MGLWLLVGQISETNLGRKRWQEIKLAYHDYVEFPLFFIVIQGFILSN